MKNKPLLIILRKDQIDDVLRLMLETLGCNPLSSPKRALHDLLYIRRRQYPSPVEWAWYSGRDMSELFKTIHEQLGDHDIINISGVEDEDIISTN